MLEIPLDEAFKNLPTDIQESIIGLKDHFSAEYEVLKSIRDALDFPQNEGADLFFLIQQRIAGKTFF